MSKQKNRPRLPRYLGAAFSLLLIAFTGHATADWMRSKPLDETDVKRLAESISDFPITANAEVVKWLNYYTKTAKGRSHVLAALERMKKYETHIRKELGRYGWPEALLAVPLMESGFRNDLPENAARAIGLWQFIPTTAHNYGLQPSDRRNPVLETDAALRLLGALFLRFQDWELAVTAYNAGEHRVQTGINRTRSRDAWKIIRSGYGGDNGYLAKIQAGALILHHRNLL